ncbi:unnamed protein product [Rangifer tarandus platyrhynchus]|uniref:Uncharacterized protein n=1 Tax=Rangifer tarandus platyrhynchus TaxID=3082113 RepID=A0ABN8ZFU4_RANTA|nr:unnamed protein product [Rangifer tarandus platyrhynchus]
MFEAGEQRCSWGPATSDDRPGAAVGWKEEEPPEQQKPGLEKPLLSSSVPKAWAESRELGAHQAQRDGHASCPTYGGCKETQGFQDPRCHGLHLSVSGWQPFSPGSDREQTFLSFPQ